MQVRVDSQLLDKFEVKLDMDTNDQYFLLFFAYIYIHVYTHIYIYMYLYVVNTVANVARESVLSELMYVDDSVLMMETIEIFTNEFRKRNDFESKSLMINLSDSRETLQRMVCPKAKLSYVEFVA